MKTVKLTQLMTLLTMTALGDALAVTVFLTPYNYNSGGASGIVMILQHIMKFPLGIGMLGLNFVMLCVAFFLMKRKYVLFTSVSVMIQSLEFLILGHFHYALPKELGLLSAVIGGIIEGMAVAYSFKHKFSFGGMDLLCKLVQKISGRNIGTLNLILKGCVLLISFAFAPSINSLIGSIVFLVSTSTTANSIVLGKAYWLSWVEKLDGILTLLRWNAKGEMEPAALYEMAQEYESEEEYEEDEYVHGTTVTSHR